MRNAESYRVSCETSDYLLSATPHINSCFSMTVDVDIVACWLDHYTIHSYIWCTSKTATDQNGHIHLANDKSFGHQYMHRPMPSSYFCVCLSQAVRPIVSKRPAKFRIMQAIPHDNPWNPYGEDWSIRFPDTSARKSTIKNKDKKDWQNIEPFWQGCPAG